MSDLTRSSPGGKGGCWYASLLSFSAFPSLSLLATSRARAYAHVPLFAPALPAPAGRAASDER
ncbi:hypothetical protein OH76DRAFT_1394816 [Lentinus brumalis]|uniref:Uncharacterized protein n=1 Tax=Lentinus brumalis TaxID=2498619 RepID=A0A371DX10_9APHY|nr:hypothetical protein OH76DRAFT_1394816 [Polyporus brumalis]